MAELYPRGKSMEFQHWYAIFVWSGEEDKVRRLLERKLSDKGIAAQLFVPKIRRDLPADLRLKLGLKEKPDPNEKERDKLMFQGYVLVGTDDIKGVFDVADGWKNVLRFLREPDGEFHEIDQEEILWIVSIADEDGIIGVSEVCFDEDNRIVALSGPLKGKDNRVTKFDRKGSCAMVEFVIGDKRHEVWLGVRVVEGRFAASGN